MDNRSSPPGYGGRSSDRSIVLKLKTDGFYSTGAVPWDDWHAGVHMKGESYHYWRFYADRSWIKASRNIPELDFWQFTESIDQEILNDARRGRAPQMKDGQQLCIAGAFSLASDHLIARFKPESSSQHGLEWRFDETERGLIWRVGDAKYLLYYNQCS